MTEQNSERSTVTPTADCQEKTHESKEVVEMTMRFNEKYSMCRWEDYSQLLCSFLMNESRKSESFATLAFAWENSAAY